MSAGLMSCVRENSPPMGNEGATISVAGTQSSSNTDTDTVKRRRFHPLRNLRKIFRRRTVSHAEAPPLQIHNFGTGSSSTTDSTTVSSKSGHMPISGGYLYLKRDHSTERYSGRNAENESSDMDTNRCEISDCQRSLSEGRLIDSDISREHLSQSHDSVFSESATASSLSIVLKAELTDVLRKRGLRQEASEEEDLGLPQSPNSPNRKEKHHSQGSLSILSNTSSDMDDEHSSLRQNTTFDSSSSSYFTKSSDFSHGSDEVDLDISSSSRLSHSAAKHKLAVRPKKKGPTRPRRSRETANVLPSTPEVNEENLKHAASNSDITSTPTKKLKSQSLPREADSKQMFAFSSKTSEIIRTPQKTTIYVNKNISKSHDFDKPASATNIIVSGNSSSVLKKTDENSSLIKKFWNRNVKKHKDEEIDVMEAEDEQEERVSDCMEHKSILQINTEMTTDIPVQSRPKSGPAARQRVVPKEIEEPIKERASIVVGQKPPVESKTVNKLQTSSKPIPITRTHLGNNQTRINVHKSEEDLLSKSYEKEIKAHSISPQKTSWQEQHQLIKTPKIIGLSSLQQKVSNMSSESPTKKGNVPKSNSFRVFSTSTNITSDSNLEKNNLPSLPNLNKISDESDNLTIIEEPLKFSSLTEHYTVKKGLSQEKLSDIGKQKFEINDFNLVKHKKDTGVEIVGVLKKKNIVLKGAEDLSQSTVSSNTTNISQIEENIDKLMKSSVVTMLKNASFEEDDIKMELIDTSSSEGSITPESTKSPVKEVISSTTKSSDVIEKAVVLREKRVSSVLEQFEAKRNPEIKAKPAVKITKPETKNGEENVPKVELRESKPPKPPTSFRISPKNIPDTTSVETPSSPVKTHNSNFEETEPRRSIIGDNDDRKVILQRRTSVSEERLKFERRISGGAPDDKLERKKSQSEEELDIISSQNNKKASNTSDEDEAPVVTLRKKSTEKLSVENGKKDDTPELMKVFARRSLKIQLDDDDNIHVQEIKKIAAANNVDSDKENQSNSEEKLDKITSNTNNQSSNTTSVTTNNNLPTTVPTSQNNKSNSVNNTTSSVVNPKVTTGIKANNENVIDSKTNLVTPKPFGTPSRFSNVSNYRSSNTFIETRNKNIQLKTLTNNNINNNATGSPQSNITSTAKGKEDVKNNNNRHTIGATVIENTSKNIEADEPEEIEFKGILQRRAEWEKRAKEGFK
uniref:CSON000024 protein n=1 Tax=Culicoides sonorensis TaxID=179676 RepID=A0A336KV59_CULSO